MIKIMGKIVLFLLLLCTAERGYAQMYTGMTGLLHTPSAEMNPDCTAVLGGYLLNRELMPDVFKHAGQKYHSMTYYLSITFLPWMELGYTCTMVKRKKSYNETVGYIGKDRYFSAKIRLLKERKWLPAVVLGCNDPYTTSEKNGTNQHFSNYYAAMSKSFRWGQDKWGVHVAYRHYQREMNEKWNGLVGGVTYRPHFANDALRMVVEYNAKTVNIGADYLLWKFLRIQGMLQNGKYFSGGLCCQVKL